MELDTKKPSGFMPSSFYSFHTVSSATPLLNPAQLLSFPPSLDHQRLRQIPALPNFLAHPTAINMQRASPLSNANRICSVAARALAGGSLVDLVQRDAISHKCSCQRDSALIPSGWGINKGAKKHQRSRAAGLGWKNIGGG